MVKVLRYHSDRLDGRRRKFDNDRIPNLMGGPA